jgi:hypothetical protein
MLGHLVSNGFQDGVGHRPKGTQNLFDWFWRILFRR